MTEPLPDAAESLRIACSVARDELVEELTSAEFRQVESSDTWRGRVGTEWLQEAERHGLSPVGQLVEIRIPDEFPFSAPAVTPLDAERAATVLGSVPAEYHVATNSWHREQNGSLCLFVEADKTELPWTDGGVLLEQIAAWIAADAAGWPADPPALDAERYLPASPDRRLILWDDSSWMVGEVRRLQPQKHDVLRVAGIAAKKKSGRRRPATWASDAVMILDVGELVHPIRDWSDLEDSLGPVKEHLLRAHQLGLRAALIRYRRGSLQGVLAVDWVSEHDGTVALRGRPAAPDDAATRQRRSHAGHEELATKRVALVGVGAVGSVVADLLHRSGVGELHLIDPDLVLPGNTRRHLADEPSIGMPKVDAVIEVLRGARPATECRLTGQRRSLLTATEALGLLETFDLVIDATADSTASAVLAAAAREGVGQLLAVCVLGDGYAVRVDRIPTAGGEAPLEMTPVPAALHGTFEAGCSSPVSTTPPAAVWEAASLGARHAVDLLLTPDRVPAGEVRLAGTRAVPGDDSSS